MNDRTKTSSEEFGSVAPLAIGLAVLSLATILLVASVSSVFVLERRLTTLAEFAALSGAESGMSAVTFLEEANPQGFSDLTVAKDEISDGKTSEVVICASWSAPVPIIVKLGSRVVCGQGAARAG
jgi:hypothetical protein